MVGSVRWRTRFRPRTRDTTTLVYPVANLASPVFLFARGFAAKLFFPLFALPFLSRLLTLLHGAATTLVLLGRPACRPLAFTEPRKQICRNPSRAKTLFTESPKDPKFKSELRAFKSPAQPGPPNPSQLGKRPLDLNFKLAVLKNILS